MNANEKYDYLIITANFQVNLVSSGPEETSRIVLLFVGNSYELLEFLRGCAHFEWIVGLMIPHFSWHFGCHCSHAIANAIIYVLCEEARHRWWRCVKLRCEDTHRQSSHHQPHIIPSIFPPSPRAGLEWIHYSLYICLLLLLFKTCIRMCN